MSTNNNKDKKTKTETTRKPLPQSNIAGKRKEIFNLNTTKEKKSREN